MEKFAVIDLGSNSARMGIYSDENGFCEHYRNRFNCRLAEGLASDNLLKDAPMERTLSALKSFKEYIDTNNIKTTIAVATECLRRAKNSDYFISLVKKETDIDIKIIDGKDEAIFGMYAACLSTDKSSFYVLDTGGGSVELSLVENSALTDFISLPYGCVVLTEDFAPDINGPEKLLDFLKEKFLNLPFINSKGLPVVALGGSVKVLADAVVKTGNIDGLSVDRDTVFSLFESIVNTPLSERPTKFNMEDARKDIITAGLAPLISLMTLTNSKNVYVCTKSVRDGVALNFIKSQKEEKNV